jgi:biotin-(acetyl-CoA carboxylase) ligase
MALGILTESGIIMNSAPILLDEKETSLLGLHKKSHKNEKITHLIDLQKKLKKFDNMKNAKKPNYKAYHEKEKLLNDIITILADSDKNVNGHMFKYTDEFDLIRA